MSGRASDTNSTPFPINPALATSTLCCPMLAAPFDSADADKFDAAFTRKGRMGLGFTAQSNNTTTSTLYQTQAQRELLSSSNNSSFSASAYLQKFGWKAGTGLGKREDGKVSYVKVSKKEDQAGIGAGLAVQAIARSFETVFNNAARNFNVVIHADSDDEEDDDEAEVTAEAEERKEERTEKKEEGENEAEVKKREKRDKKRKRREEQEEERKQLSSDEDSSTPTSTSPQPPPALTTTTAIRPVIAFKSASSTTTSSLSIPVVAPDSLLSFDPSRSHMYHDRCKGKLARLQAQESMGQHIVEAVKRKRWEGLVAGEERKEATVVEIGEDAAGTEAVVEGDEEERRKRKAEKKERKRREREAVQQAEQESKEEPLTNEAIEAEEEAQRKRRKQEKREAKRRRQTQ